MPTHTDKQRLNLTADELISVTIDASDLTVAAAEPLRNILSRYGRPVTSRAFADFQQPILADLAVQLYQMGFSLMHCPTWPNGDGFPKSIVSDVMAQDLRDQLEELEEVETFLLVATSRDYIAVANALRRHDKRVVVVAEEAKVCRELRMCADEFAILPPTRPERSGRYVDRSSEAARVERAVEASRVERTPEPARSERAQESGRPERTEPQEAPKLPSDSEVLAEVRKIVAAEGICTPRRLARALCPVDRTATGELRSRIANRIQALVDVGKLQRERLVVGGTSVETILARDEKNGRPGRAAPREAASAPAPSAEPEAPAKGPEAQPGPQPEREAEPEPAVLLEPAGGDGVTLSDLLTEPAAETPAPEPEPQKSLALPNDLDALVESVLRAPDLAAGLLHREPETDAKGSAPQSEAEPAKEEPPARSRPRRRSSSKKAAAPEPNTAQ